MTDWKTTLTGIITGAATILAHFNVIFPESWQAIIIAVGVALLSVYAKDASPKQ